MSIACIFGSTGSGKTALAIKIAKQLEERFGKKCNAISVDSMQQFKDLTLTTAQPSKIEQNALHHHFVDCTETLNTDSTVLHFIQKVHNVLDSSQSSTEKVTILVGGCHFYLKALLFDYCQSNKIIEIGNFIPRKRNPAITNFTHRMLKNIDPESSIRFHSHDLRRVENACESYFDSRIPYSLQIKNENSETINQKFKEMKFIFLRYSNDVIKSRIKQRFDLMHSENKCLKEFQEFYKSYSGSIVDDNGEDSKHLLGGLPEALFGASGNNFIGSYKCIRCDKERFLEA
ncbi:MAG: tRNA dimethylallyltransferase [Paramarteilia canceri]